MGSLLYLFSDSYRPIYFFHRLPTYVSNQSSSHRTPLVASKSTNKRARYCGSRSPKCFFYACYRCCLFSKFTSSLKLCIVEQSETAFIFVKLAGKFSRSIGHLNLSSHGHLWGPPGADANRIKWRSNAVICTRRRPTCSNSTELLQ